MVTVIEVAAFDNSVSGFPIVVGNFKEKMGMTKRIAGMMKSKRI